MSHDTYTVRDQKFVVVEMPEPRAEGEPALVIVQTQPTPLVFSLRQQGSRPHDTMLLEERPGGVRNLGGGIDPTDRKAFITELAALARGDGSFRTGGTANNADYRTHHYVFAHKYLPSVFYQDPTGFSEIFEEEPEKYMRSAWEGIAATIDEEARLSTPKFEITAHTRPDGTIWVVKMPEPIAVPEAHFVAFTTSPRPRVFTLERGADHGDGPTPFFCAWEPDGTHSNWGRVDIDSAEDFAALIRAKIAKGGAGTDAL